MEQISVTNSTKVKKNVVECLSYVPNGVSIDVSTLVAGVLVPEATPLAAPSSGKRLICKQAVLLVGSTGTVLKLTNGSHHFAVGNVIMLTAGGAAYTVQTITTANGVDDVTLNGSIGAPSEGDFVYEAAVEGASGAALENDADAILKEAFWAPAAGTRVIEVQDALLHALVAQNSVGPLYLAQLKGVIEVKY